MKKSLSADKEALAQRLAEELKQAVSDEVLEMARTLVDTDDQDLFGDTEFQIREQLLKIGRLLYQKHLDQKKTATTQPPPSARTASAPPTSRGTAPETS
jgi:hypothetical protein